MTTTTSITSSTSSSTASTTTTSTSSITNRVFNVPVVAAAVATIAIGVGIAIVGLVANQQQTSEQDFVDFVFVEEINGIAPTSFNDLTIPVTGQNFRKRSIRESDGCVNGWISFDDGNCYPLLKRGPYPDLRQWLTVDPFTLRVNSIEYLQIGCLC